MYVFEPSPNLARQSQIFQIWIRPVEPPTAVFALRLALFELDRLVREGVSEQDFQYAKSYVLKNVNLLLKTKRAQLGYAIDSKYYGIPEYGQYIRDSVSKLTREDVNKAIRKHLQTRNLEIVAVTANGDALKQKLASGEPSPITYNSPKSKEITEEDKIVERYPLDLSPEHIRVVKVDTVFE
jgi:zinc protease